jgi:hypothetical protein
VRRRMRRTTLEITKPLNYRLVPLLRSRARNRERASERVSYLVTIRGNMSEADILYLKERDRRQS